MLDSTTGTARELDFDGWKPCPSGGGMLVIQQEEAHHCLVVVAVCARRPGQRFLREAVAVAHIVDPAQTVFGYPNEEAYWKDPRELGHGFYEIVESPWWGEVRRYNLATFGDSPYYPPAMPALRHFFIGSKDDSFQALAHDLRVTIEEKRPFDEVAAEAFSCILHGVDDEASERLRRSAKLSPAAEWRSHRLMLEEWRTVLQRYLAGDPPDAARLRELLLARLPAAEDAVAASGRLRGYRPQALALYLERFEEHGPGENRAQAGRDLLGHVESRISDLEIAEQKAEGA